MDKFINTELLNIPNFLLVMFSIVIFGLLVHVVVTKTTLFQGTNS